MVRFNIFQHVRSYLLVFLAHKEQVYFVLHTRAEWTVVVQQYVTHCVPVLTYFEITNTQSYTNQTVPEAFVVVVVAAALYCLCTFLY